MMLAGSRSCAAPAARVWGGTLLFLTCGLLAACDGNSRAMPDLRDVRASLAFTCTYERDHIPPRDPEADQLYQHAKWLKKGNLLKEDPQVYPKIGRLIRISTAYGHDLANLELRQMIGKSTAESIDIVNETLDLTEDLIKRGIPGGYYDMARYLEQGYGVKEDKALTLKHYRKSADLGSPEGQFVVGEKLYATDEARKIAEQMLHCAAEQGHDEAGLSLGNKYAALEHYPEALEAFQVGAKAGDPTAASFLEGGFSLETAVETPRNRSPFDRLRANGSSGSHPSGDSLKSRSC